MDYVVANAEVAGAAEGVSVPMRFTVSRFSRGIGVVESRDRSTWVQLGIWIRPDTGLARTTEWGMTSRTVIAFLLATDVSLAARKQPSRFKPAPEGGDHARGPVIVSPAGDRCLRPYPCHMGERMESVERQSDAIHDIARRHRARSVSVFGSVARGEDRPGSDIDFLVEFEPGASLLDLMAIQDDLEALLACRADVVSAGGLKDRDEHIRREAVLV